MTEKLNLTKSNKLFEEAQKLVPGGVLGIRRPYNFVVGEYPIFFDKGEGGNVYDVDGNKYIDMLCAYGPIILGHREKEVDDAVIKQIQEKGFCMSLTQEVQNRLAKKLSELIPSCEQVIFVKTGSDGTTAAIRIARAYTQKKKILRCGYHGWHDWCVEVKGGVPEKLYEDIHEFHYNNLDEVTKLIETHKNDLAAIIITPIGHPLAHEVEMPKPGFLEEIRKMATHHKCVLIFDEIRSGFRFNLGGAQKVLGVTPDVSVFGKALGNGYSIGAVVGKKEFMDMYREKAFISSTFFPNSLSQVAALKVIEIMEREKVIDKIKERGTRFGNKVQKIISDSPIDCTLSGAPLMPFITFNKDSQNLYKKIRVDFYTELIRRGVFLQPYHHGYIAYRHTDKDLDYVANTIGETLDLLKQKYL